MQATALVTGGTGGLGVPVVEQLLASGMRVVVPWIAERELERLPAEPQADGSLVTVQADLFDETSVAEVVELAAAVDSQPLTGVVNLVGGFAQGPRLADVPVADFERMVDLNLKPTFLVTRAALPKLLAAGGGSVVCVSSRTALEPARGGAGYSVGKAAVLAFVKAVDADYREDKIRCNAVLPSVIDTPANREAMPNTDPDIWVKPQQLAETIDFLLSDESAATSGATIPVYARA